MRIQTYQVMSGIRPCGLAHISELNGYFRQLYGTVTYFHLASLVYRSEVLWPHWLGVYPCWLLLLTAYIAKNRWSRYCHVTRSSSPWFAFNFILLVIYKAKYLARRFPSIQNQFSEDKKLTVAKYFGKKTCLQLFIEINNKWEICLRG